MDIPTGAFCVGIHLVYVVARGAFPPIRGGFLLEVFEAGVLLVVAFSALLAANASISWDVVGVAKAFFPRSSSVFAFWNDATLTSLTLT